MGLQIHRLKAAAIGAKAALGRFAVALREVATGFMTAPPGT
jgi:hypothetical protein